MQQTPKNLYYYDEKAIDLNKLREEAAKAAIGDSRNLPCETTIHYHSSVKKCEGYKHEFYPAVSA